MTKSTPDKLAEALRANLRRRKAGAAPNRPEKSQSDALPPQESAPQKPPKEQG